MHYTVATHRILLFRLLLPLGETVNLHAQVIAGLLPEDLAVGHVEQILISNLITTESGEKKS